MHIDYQGAQEATPLAACCPQLPVRKAAILSAFQ